MTFRAEDAVLLERLEDEDLLERMFHFQTGATSGMPHPRAAGMFATARRLIGGDAVVAAAMTAGNVAELVRFLEAPPMSARPPELLHHLALYEGAIARALESHAPEAAANAWTRSIAAWIALGDERSYLRKLSEAVIGKDAQRPDTTIAPEHVVLDVLAQLAERATASARSLAAPGRAALLALSWIDEAARLAGATETSATRVRAAAERRRGAVLEAALSPVAEAFEDAKARDRLASDGSAALLRALDVWRWTGEDEAVEEFCVERLAPIGWELYRARRLDTLRAILDPFRGLIEHLAARIEGDSSRIAYAAACAEMLVFLADVEDAFDRKLAFAERALRVCPTHRNGRLTVATLLCQAATASMRGRRWGLDRRGELGRLAELEELVARAEELHPDGTAVKAAREMLTKVKSGATVA